MASPASLPYLERETALEETEKQPLLWPEGQPRTRIQDREGKSAWKKNLHHYKIQLEQELKRSGATEWLITSNPAASPDPGVAVYFSRRPQNQFAWQEALGFVGRVPTVDEIGRAYKERIRRIHPDGPTPDAELFRSITDHRDRALDYALGRHRADHEYVIAIDVFDELRLNINAVKIVLYSLRRIEDCGSPLMLERAFRGFHKQISAGVQGVNEAVTA